MSTLIQPELCEAVYLFSIIIALVPEHPEVENNVMHDCVSVLSS